MEDKRNNLLISFNSDFLSTLEYHLSETFSTIDDSAISRFWCDGIEAPLVFEQYNSNNITSINKLLAKARIGQTGQDSYLMTIIMGPCARRRSLKGWDLNCCLHDAKSSHWVSFDVEGKTISRLKHTRHACASGGGALENFLKSKRTILFLAVSSEIISHIMMSVLRNTLSFVLEVSIKIW